MQLLLDVAPQELAFEVALGRAHQRTLSIRNAGTSRVAFKVKTTAPKRYCVRPNSGLVAPGESATLQVILQPLKENPEDMAACKDKFQVLGIHVPDALPDTATSEEIGKLPAWERPDYQQKLKCKFVKAAEAPHTPAKAQPEENAEGAPFKTPRAERDRAPRTSSPEAASASAPAAAAVAAAPASPAASAPKSPAARHQEAASGSGAHAAAAAEPGEGGAGMTKEEYEQLLKNVVGLTAERDNLREALSKAAEGLEKLREEGKALDRRREEAEAAKEALRKKLAEAQERAEKEEARASAMEAAAQAATKRAKAAEEKKGEPAAAADGAGSAAAKAAGADVALGHAGTLTWMHLFATALICLLLGKLFG